ncbi:AbrB/MazE/SpoVT family DNA-binding domain-containing protein [Paenibacillus sp. FSL R7-277]|uniref:AbrB/MazE/SpoVT family DNA-binding domain-containing protein n=1 Tax=Paenibacillus sp. FSL R7-277 TaxID=1227352 RepID=UPI0009DFF3C1|nr:hypothetical protein [Paenibacillus sp. FSL R7-277]
MSSIRIRIEGVIHVRHDKEDGQLNINPKSVTLDEILSWITPDNIHHEVSTGGQQGREVW